MINAPFSLKLPPSKSNPQDEDLVESLGTVVIIGANGSGKTRLGTWIETNSLHPELVHRISAQKSLMIPDYSPTMNLADAETNLFYGAPHAVPSNRIGNRWQGKPNTAPLNDFDKLMVYLFSEDYEKSTAYRQASSGVTEKIEPPVTKLDTIGRLWRSVLPHRELKISAGKIEAEAGSARYLASEMSDGERVIFYLIGQCLSAAVGATIIIDEPELHVHKSIQAPLWDAIEAERPDCLFVFITHDLEFAMTRVGAPKICVTSFDGAEWSWFPAPEDDAIPEEILLQIIGNRKPVIFTEGDKSSLDHFLFSRLYDSFTVVPLGGCEQVIHATGSFASLKRFHSLECAGIVDRDFRTAKQLEYLKDRSVHTLELSEVENLFLLEGVLLCVAEQLLRDNFDSIMTEVRVLVLESLKSNREVTVSGLAAAEIEAELKRYDAKAQGESGLITSLQSLVSAIDVPVIYARAVVTVDTVLDANDYVGALKIYSNKGLLTSVAKFFGIKPNELPELLKRLILSEKGGKVLDSMRPYVPAMK